VRESTSRRSAERLVPLGKDLPATATPSAIANWYLSRRRKEGGAALRSAACLRPDVGSDYISLTVMVPTLVVVPESSPSMLTKPVHLLLPLTAALVTLPPEMA
jgi:hypothetical protein